MGIPVFFSASASRAGRERLSVDSVDVYLSSFSCVDSHMLCFMACAFGRVRRQLRSSCCLRAQGDCDPKLCVPCMVAEPVFIRERTGIRVVVLCCHDGAFVGNFAVAD